MAETDHFLSANRPESITTSSGRLVFQRTLAHRSPHPSNSTSVFGDETPNGRWAIFVASHFTGLVSKPSGDLRHAWVLWQLQFVLLLGQSSTARSQGRWHNGLQQCLVQESTMPGGTNRPPGCGLSWIAMLKILKNIETSTAMYMDII